MGDIRLSIGQTGITNYMIVGVYETSTPTVPAATPQVFTPPVPTQQNIFFTGLNPVPHNVEIRTSADGVTPGLLLGRYVYDVKNQVVLSEQRFYTAGGAGEFDPVAGSLSITDPYFESKVVSGVFKEAFRFLIPAVEFSQSGSTLTLLLEHLALGDQEVVMVEMAWTSNSESGGAMPFPADIIPVTGDITLDETHRNMCVECIGAGLIQKLTFPPFSTIPDNAKFAFNTDNGSQRYVTLIIDPGNINYALHRGKLRNRLHMGKGEYLVLQKKDNYMRILDWRGQADRVGEVVTADIQPVNSIPETGGWLPIRDYVRLFEWYVLELPPNLLGSGTFPIPPIGSLTKWCIDVVNNMFWVPDTGGYFPRFTDPDGNVDSDRPSNQRRAGTTQGHQVGEHNITLPKGYSYTGSPNVLRMGNGNNSPTDFSLTVNAGKETRPLNVNRNQYRLI